MTRLLHPHGSPPVWGRSMRWLRDIPILRPGTGGLPDIRDASDPDVSLPPHDCMSDDLLARLYPFDILTLHLAIAALQSGDHVSQEPWSALRGGRPGESVYRLIQTPSKNTLKTQLTAGDVARAMADLGALQGISIEAMGDITVRRYEALGVLHAGEWAWWLQRHCVRLYGADNLMESLQGMPVRCAQVQDAATHMTEAVREHPGIRCIVPYVPEIALATAILYAAKVLVPTGVHVQFYDARYRQGILLISFTGFLHPRRRQALPDKRIGKKLPISSL